LTYSVNDVILGLPLKQRKRKLRTKIHVLLVRTISDWQTGSIHWQSER